MKYRQLLIGVIIGVSLTLLASFAFWRIMRMKPGANISVVAQTAPKAAPIEFAFVAVTLGESSDEMERLLTSHNIVTRVNGEGFGNWFSVPAESRSEAMKLLKQHGYEQFVDDAMSWNQVDN